MDIVSYLNGFVEIEATGTRPQELLNRCAREGIRFRSCKTLDSYTIRFAIARQDEKRLHSLAKYAGCETKSIKRAGVPFFMFRIRGRLALFAGLALTLAVLLASSLFIWEIEVTGNETVSTAAILNALEDSGVQIGSFWPTFSSEQIQNLVLEEIPELSFLTVNVFGSRAEVIVREKTPIPELLDESQATNIVASSSGIITEMFVYRGVAAVNLGQTVLAGEMLVSGAPESEFAGIRTVHASAVVNARTWYELTAVAPLETTQKVYTGETKTRLALNLGDKRINIYGSTGISGAGYDKITKEHALAISGVFRLPVAIVAERYERFDTVTVLLEEEAEKKRLEEYLYAELLRRLGDDGEIIEHSFTWNVAHGAVYVTIHAECLENIACEQIMTQEDLRAIEFANETREEDPEE